ncbi:hypothetical protein BH20CHL7_BH20CHL7_10060 [soil metagenome]
MSSLPDPPRLRRPLRTSVATGRALGAYAGYGPAVLVLALLLSVLPNLGAKQTTESSSAPSSDVKVQLQDGVPESIDGAPVLWGLDARSGLLGATGDERFLIGVYVDTNSTTTCTAQRGSEQLTQGEIPPDGYVEIEQPLLTTAGCGPYTFTGAPGSVLFPPPLDLEWRHDGPAVLRVHVNDARAKDCPKEMLAACSAAIVVDEVAWAGGVPDVGPHGFAVLLARALGAEVALPDGSTTFVMPDVFAVPTDCAGGQDLWYRLYGDPRLSMVTFGVDGAAATPPSAEEAANCLGANTTDGQSSWVSLGSASVLSSGGATFDELLRDSFERDLDGSAILAVPSADDASAAMHELQAYLQARAIGIVESAWGSRLVVEVSDEDEVSNAYAAWLNDAMDRASVNALSGPVQALGPADGLDSDVLEQVARHGGVDARLYQVSHPEATESDLETEFYVVFRREPAIPSRFGVLRVSQ